MRIHGHNDTFSRPRTDLTGSPCRIRQCNAAVRQGYDETAGFGLKYNAWTLDFAYIYMQEREVHLKKGGTAETLACKFGNGYDHTFALTLGYKF